MADFSKSVWFQFSVPPGGSVDTPKVKVDASSLSTALQAVLLRVLPTISIESTSGAAELVFGQGEEEGDA